MGDILLDVIDLKIHFFTDEGVVKAVDGVDLAIERGKTLCLVGESGCGKSVTCRAFLRLIANPGRLVSGEMHFRSSTNGTIDLAQLDPKGSAIRDIRGKEIAMIFQEPMTSLSLMHTVGDQIMESVLLHENVLKPEARDRAIEMLQRVGIPKPDRLVDEYPFRLSGGMRQRAMIAMALSCNPTMLIADEPTTALDVTTQAQILDLMLDLQRQDNMTLMFITHDLGVVAEIADDVAVMYLGRIVERASVDTIFNAPQHPYTQALLRSIPKIAMQRDELDPIKGMVPSPYRRPSGCTFHPRCSRRIEACNRIVPSVTELAPGHTVRCLLYENIQETEALQHG
ncbi:MAG: ABC transporter ATP-binding protein [Anaerolineae bacterium]|nr:ABC transporter ATP-binding protein [Anaerolineae bacterium]